MMMSCSSSRDIIRYFWQKLVVCRNQMIDEDPKLDASISFLEGQKNNDLLERELLIKDKKNIAAADWPEGKGVVELIKMRGNFWKSTGFSRSARNFMYPEEAVFLTERYQLLVERNGNYFPFDQMYAQMLEWVPLQCYLTFMKLKSLDYIVFRHNEIVPCISNDADILELLLKSSSRNLLECVVSFDIYPHDSNFSKKNRRDLIPVGYVVVFSGSTIPSAKIMLKMIEEAKGVPILLSMCSSSGSVLLEEFSDALSSIDWINTLALPKL